MQSNINYTDEGDGIPLLFIHGFCETSQMWEDFKKPFIEKYRVITIDLPGFGSTPLPESDFSIADIANTIIKFLNTSLNINQVIIIGHSLGGYVTLEMVKLQPELVAGFTLFHSTAYADDEEKKDSRNKTIDFVKKRGVKVFAESFVPSLFYQKNRKRLAETIDEVVEIAAQTPLETLVTYTKAMRDRNDRTDVLKQFEGTISIIAGQEDTSVPMEKIQEQELLPKQGIVHYLDDCGHMGMHETKAETQQMIKDFIGICV